MTNSIEKELKELMLDEDFTNIKDLVNKEVNLMDILRDSHKELQHSNFLAWFFNPSESHNLGDFAFKEFIKFKYSGDRKNQDYKNQAGCPLDPWVTLRSRE